MLSREGARFVQRTTLFRADLLHNRGKLRRCEVFLCAYVCFSLSANAEEKKKTEKLNLRPIGGKEAAVSQSCA